jgi:cyclic-di-GMP-binding protein
MLPRYLLPARESGRNINFETKPKQVDAWITRLPLSDPQAAAEAMADYLATLNRIEIAQNARAKIIERMTPVVEDITASLYEQYRSAPLPLLPKQQRSADLAKRLLHALADGYKILLIDRLKRRFRMFGRKPISLYLQRILLALQAMLEISFETHAPVPDEAWVDLHQTFNYALRNGLRDSIPEGGSKMLSIEQIYKATLLLALADPYRFPQAELPWAIDIIARYSNLATIFSAEDTIKGHTGLFVIDINTDSAPTPIVRHSHPKNPRSDLLINTTDLAKHLALIASRLKGPEAPEKIGLPEVARNPSYPTMLLRLKLNWGASLQRQSQRRRQSNGRNFEVCFGLNSVHQLIASTNTSNDIDISSIDISSMDISQPPPVIVRCKTVNDSMGGLALIKIGNTPVQIGVGDIVGIRQDKAHWSIGLVRWFRITTEDEMFFGIQLMAPQALAIKVKRKDNGRQWPCLLLHPSPNSKQLPMLLAQPGCFSPDIPAEINTPKGNQLVQIEKRIEATPSIELFRLLMRSQRSA